MNIFNKFTELDMSESEQEIIDLIMKDPYAFSEMSVDEIAAKCYVSRATVYRLCKKLGLSGLSDLKVQIKTDLEHYEAENSGFDFNYPVESHDSEWKIANILKEDYEKTLLSTLNLLNHDELKKAAYRIDQCRMVNIYTDAGNIYFAKNFAFQMMEINRQVNVPEVSYMQRLAAATSDKDVFSIVISFGGRALQIETLCKILRDRNSPVLLICSAEAKALYPYGDYRLLLSPHEDHYRKISSFSTRISLLYLLDMLYTCIFNLDYEKNKEAKTAYYHEMNRF